METAAKDKTPRPGPEKKLNNLKNRFRVVRGTFYVNDQTIDTTCNSFQTSTAAAPRMFGKL